MAEIENVVVFAKEHKQLIDTELNQPEIDHRRWGSSELLDLRVFIRNHYRDEQTGYCAYCRKDVSLRSVMNCHVEHIAPKSIYPEFMFHEKNLCVACADCNEIKREQETMECCPDTIVDGSNRSQYPRSSKAFYIVHPHFDIYEEHILIHNGYYIDLTEKGHFTIGACMLNRRPRRFGHIEYVPEATEDTELFQSMSDFVHCTGFVEKSRAFQKMKKLVNIV